MNDYTLNKSESYFYTSITKSFNKFAVQANIGYLLSFFNDINSTDSYKFNTLITRFNTSIPIKSKANINFNYKNANVNPSLLQLSKNQAFDDNFIIHQGNPHLKPYNEHDFSLKYDLFGKKASYGIQFQYSFSQNPIFVSYKQNLDHLISSYSNEKSKNSFVLSYYLTFKMLNNKMNITIYNAGYGYIDKYKNGNINKLFAFYYSFMFDYYYKNFILKGNIENPLKDTQGQKNITNPVSSDISLYYKFKYFNLGTGIYLPFHKSSKTTLELNSQFIKSNSSNQILDNGHMFYVRLVYNFTFDKQMKIIKKIQNKDKDKGYTMSFK